MGFLKLNFNSYLGPLFNGNKNSYVEHRDNHGWNVKVEDRSHHFESHVGSELSLADISYGKKRPLGRYFAECGTFTPVVCIIMKV